MNTAIKRSLGPIMLSACMLSAALPLSASPQLDEAPRLDEAPQLDEGPRLDEQAPAYSKLAYQPESPTRIADMPAQYFTVQLLAVSSKQQIERFAEQHDLYNMVAVQIVQNDKPLYVLMPGVYETREQAAVALQSLPDGVKSLKPWIRSLSSLQSVMRSKPRTQFAASD